jgi:hypothetical protein
MAPHSIDVRGAGLSDVALGAAFVILAAVLVGIAAVHSASGGSDRDLTADRHAPGVVERIAVGPGRDGYVRANRPTQRFSRNAQLRVDRRPLVESFVTFPVPAFKGRAFTAKVRFYAITPSARGFRLRSVLSDWRARRLTFVRRPVVGAIRRYSGPLAAKTWVSIDVTPLVQSGRDLRIALEGVSRTELALASAQDRRHPPKLIVSVGSPPSR